MRTKNILFPEYVLRTGGGRYGKKPPEEKCMAQTKTDWKIVNMLQKSAAHIDCEEHFAIGENAKVEIAKVRKTRHAVYNINYHLVWIPKTRMRILTQPFKCVI